MSDWHARLPELHVHPAEACHGDLGMIRPHDVVLALPNSGETDELLTMLPVLRRLGVQMLSLTGNRESTLARQADINLQVSSVSDIVKTDRLMGAC